MSPVGDSGSREVGVWRGVGFDVDAVAVVGEAVDEDDRTPHRATPARTARRNPSSARFSYEELTQAGSRRSPIRCHNSARNPRSVGFLRISRGWSSPSCRFPSQVKRMAHLQDTRLPAHLRFRQPWRPFGATTGCRLYLAFRCLRVLVACWLPNLLPIVLLILLVPACPFVGNRQANFANRSVGPRCDGDAKGMLDHGDHEAPVPRLGIEPRP